MSLFIYLKRYFLVSPIVFLMVFGVSCNNKKKNSTPDEKKETLPAPPKNQKNSEKPPVDPGDNNSGDNCNSTNKPKPTPVIEKPVMVVKKPIIYLYPQSKTMINVQFGSKIGFNVTHSYPAYKKGGWSVLANQSGILFHIQTKLSYYALYYEGRVSFKPDMSTGFVVKGVDSASFLNKILPKLGLNRREANEFIIYWLPQLQKNRYNLIHFSTKVWANKVPLKVTPKPTVSIRIMMFYSPLKKFIKVKPQKLVTPVRKGFVLVEWGGNIYSPSIIHNF